MAIDSYTKLLINFDSTPFTDSGTTGHIITNVGSKVTSVSGHFDNCGRFDNTQSAYFTVAHHSDFNFGSQDWVIDFWFRGTTPGYNWPAIYTKDISSSGGISIAQQTDGIIHVWMSSTVSTSWNVAGGVSLGSYETGVFHHYALVRSGNDYYTFKDGVQVTTWNNSSSLSWGTGTIGIGKQRTTEYINGWMDEFRVSVGTDRGWSGGFTPPTNPYGYIPSTDISIGNVNLGNLTIS